MCSFRALTQQHWTSCCLPWCSKDRGVHQAVHLYSLPLPRPGLSPRSPKHRHHLIMGEMTCEQTALQPALPGHRAQGEGNNGAKLHQQQICSVLDMPGCRNTHSAALRTQQLMIMLLQPPETTFVSVVCVRVCRQRVQVHFYFQKK